MSDEKTERPTDKKLRDARKKGQVAHSKDAPKAAVFAAFVLALMIGGASVVEQAVAMLHLAGTYAGQPFEAVYQKAIEGALRWAAQVVLPLCVGGATLALILEFLLVGPVFSTEKITPDIQNINPLSALKNWFSVRNLIELCKSFFKLGILLVLLWLQLRYGLNGLAWLPSAGITAMAAALAKMVLQMLIGATIFFILIGALDIFTSRWLFRRDQKMSKDEVKREYKEMVGSPEIKGHRRQLHREILEGGVRQAVRKSTAVVTNPTHIAVALRYERGRTPLPVVMAMGMGVYAKAIMAEAVDAGVPIVREVYLARQLYAHASVNGYVPGRLLRAVAAVLRSLQELGDEPPR